MAQFLNASAAPTLAEINSSAWQSSALEHQSM